MCFGISFSGLLGYTLLKEKKNKPASQPRAASKRSERRVQKGGQESSVETRRSTPPRSIASYSRRGGVGRGGAGWAGPGRQRSKYRMF